MKKLFVSCPMRNRTEENIRKSIEKMHKIAEVVFDQELEVIGSYNKSNVPNCKNQAVKCLGASIARMADADYFIGVRWTDSFPGCNIEREVAERYGIPSTFVEIYELMPDAVEVERQLWCEGKVGVTTIEKK